MPMTKTTGAKRGFAAMDPAKQREIASKGGKSSHGGGRKPLARPESSSQGRDAGGRAQGSAAAFPLRRPAD